MKPASRGAAIWTAVALISGLSACASPSGGSAPVASPSPLAAGSAGVAASSAPASPTASAVANPSVEPTANPARVVEGTRYRPEIDPAGFTTDISNHYMPLVPGTVFIFEGGGERIETAVTEKTKTVMGIDTVVVRDRAFEDGTLIEDTFDWFAQDAAGNVWYFGEDTAECDNGKIASTHGAWEAGVDGAQPGVVMLAQPQVGAFYRQEFLRGEAEDVARVLDVDATVKTGSATYRDAIVTEDFSALEPKVVEHKTYAPGVGLIQAKTVKGGTGVERLSDVRTGVPAAAMPAGKLCQS